MALDFDKSNAGTVAKQRDPRDVLTTLKQNAHFKQQVGEQANVLDACDERKSVNGLSIKMITSRGKTVVGLLSLQGTVV